jgi:hypothetical protein
VRQGHVDGIKQFIPNPDLDFIRRTTGPSKYLVKQYVKIIAENENHQKSA